MLCLFHTICSQNAAIIRQRSYSMPSNTFMTESPSPTRAGHPTTLDEAVILINKKKIGKDEIDEQKLLHRAADSGEKTGDISSPFCLLSVTFPPLVFPCLTVCPATNSSWCSTLGNDVYRSQSAELIYWIIPVLMSSFGCVIPDI